MTRLRPLAIASLLLVSACGSADESAAEDQVMQAPAPEPAAPAPATPEAEPTDLPTEGAQAAPPVAPGGDEDEPLPIGDPEPAVEGGEESGSTSTEGARSRRSSGRSGGGRGGSEDGPLDGLEMGGERRAFDIEE